MLAALLLHEGPLEQRTTTKGYGRHFDLAYMFRIEKGKTAKSYPKARCSRRSTCLLSSVAEGWLFMIVTSGSRD